MHHVYSYMDNANILPPGCVLFLTILAVMGLSTVRCPVTVQSNDVISYTLSREYRWREIDIHGCYSSVKIVFAPICTCKNNQWIWRLNASTSPSRDVTDGTVATSQRQVRKKWALVTRFDNDFHGWLRHPWKSFPNRIIRDKNRYSRQPVHNYVYLSLYIWMGAVLH